MRTNKGLLFASMCSLMSDVRLSNKLFLANWAGIYHRKLHGEVVVYQSCVMKMVARADVLLFNGNQSVHFRGGSKEQRYRHNHRERRTKRKKRLVIKRVMRNISRGKILPEVD